MSGRGVIAAEPPAVCAMCDRMVELRPYGPGGSRVCFDCAQTLDPAAVERRMGEYLGIEAER